MLPVTTEYVHSGCSPTLVSHQWFDARPRHLNSAPRGIEEIARTTQANYISQEARRSTTSALNPNILGTKCKVFNRCPSLPVIIKTPGQQIQRIRDVDLGLEILPHSLVADEIGDRSRRGPEPCRAVENQIDNQEAPSDHQVRRKFALSSVELASIDAREVKKALYRGAHYCPLDCLDLVTGSTVPFRELERGADSYQDCNSKAARHQGEEEEESEKGKSERVLLGNGTESPERAEYYEDW